MGRTRLIALVLGGALGAGACAAHTPGPHSLSMDAALQQARAADRPSLAEWIRAGLQGPGTFGTGHPAVPVVVPPDIRRVWVPTHENPDGELVAGHWVYLRVRDFRWFLDVARIARHRVGPGAGGCARAEPDARRWRPGDRSAVGRGAGPGIERSDAPGVRGCGDRSTVPDRGTQPRAAEPTLRSGLMHAWTHEAIATLNADSPSLTELLPWRWVDPGAVHVLADGSLGLAWSLPLLDAELLTPEQREPMARALDGLLARLPAGIAFQVILVTQPADPAKLAGWVGASTNGGDPLLRAMVRARISTLTAPPPGLVPMRDVRVLLTIRHWPAVARARSGWRRLARWGRAAAGFEDAAGAWRETEAVLDQCRTLVESQCRVAGRAPVAPGRGGVPRRRVAAPQPRICRSRRHPTATTPPCTPRRPRRTTSSDRTAGRRTA